MEMKKFYEILSEIDGEICMTGIFAAYDEEEAEEIWKSQMYDRAKKASIPKEIVDKYIKGEI